MSEKEVYKMMDEQKLFEFHEKLYFHEAEAREKISARLQIPLAILISFATLYGYLLRGYLPESHGFWGVTFIVTGILSLGLYLTSLYYFIKGFFGSTYQFLPPADITANYHQVLTTTYKDYDGKDGYEDCRTLVERHFTSYLLTKYIECSSYNTRVNDDRSDALHKCNSFIIFNTLPLFSLFLIFIFGGIDKNSVEKEYLVKINQPVIVDNKNPVEINGSLSTTTLEIDFSEDLKEIMMANDNVKPPPPPPPTPPANRFIKEDVSIPRGTQSPPPPQPKAK